MAIVYEKAIPFNPQHKRDEDFAYRVAERYFDREGAWEAKEAHVKGVSEGYITISALMEVVR